jgi:putative methyltransferase (TIGR01177 family)
VSRVYVELSAESLELGVAEVTAAVETLGGRVREPLGPGGRLSEVELETDRARELAARLALARRCLAEAGPGEGPGAWQPVPHGASASFRPFGRPRGGGLDPRVRAAALAWRSAGGTIDLEHPDRRFWLTVAGAGGWTVLEELAGVDRRGTAARRISALPFQRPVGLPPRLARAAANLARISSESRVLDPFLGTGALLAEAALLGGRVTGIDRDPTMVQGALRNFQHLGVTAERLVVGDAGSVDPGAVLTGGPLDAVLSDPPYGRGSSTGGEATAALLSRVLPRWAEQVRPGGPVVLVLPGGPDPLPPPWRRELSVPVRVHRSLTREFRVYRRAD